MDAKTQVVYKIQVEYCIFSPPSYFQGRVKKQMKISHLLEALNSFPVRIVYRPGRLPKYLPELIYHGYSNSNGICIVVKLRQACAKASTEVSREVLSQ
jgi:hypothetical protein